MGHQWRSICTIGAERTAHFFTSPPPRPMPAKPFELSGLPSLRCPDCSKPTRRVAGQPKDQAASVPRTLRRCRCVDAACGWEGLLARPATSSAVLPPGLPAAATSTQTATPLPMPLPLPPSAFARRGRRLLVGLATAAAVVGPLAVIGVSGLELIARPATGLAATPGESHDGLPLRDRQAPIGGALLQVRAGLPVDLANGAPTALTLRQGCAWGQPGRLPYRGSTAQALAAAGLPAEVVQQIAAQRQAGGKAGRLEISRHAIRQVDGPGRFNPRSMAMTFGLTLCLHSRVNFTPGHVEPADLYQARDASGRLFSVMVPDVCGNVTVLSAAAPGGVVASVAGALAQRSEALAAVAEALGSHTAPGDHQPAAVGGGAVRPALAPDGAQQAASALGPGAVPVAYGGDAMATRFAAPAIGMVLWQGLRSSTLPRQISAGGLKRVADGLARGSEAVRVLAGPTSNDDRLGSRSPLASVSVSRVVPEPGSLACVLTALAAAWWGGRQRSSRRSVRR